MNTFQVFSALILLVAVFGYLNHRFVKLPDAIGITAVGTLVSLAAVVLAQFETGVADQMRGAVASVDFPQILLHTVLGLLLFAGSLHVDLAQVAREKWLILALATFGVLVSTVLVGGSFYLVSQWLALGIPLVYCMLFGALISPTDPVAVMAALQKLGVPASLETRIAGESLFNDGTAVVVFLTLLGLASGSESVGVASTAGLFATEVLGGAAFGLAVGAIGFRMLRRVDSYAVETLITLAMATTGYAAAEVIHVSAPIAVVLMGLIVGNRGKRDAMTDETRKRLFGFWQVLDQLSNLLLFGFIGLEMMTLTFFGDAGAGCRGRHRHRVAGAAGVRGGTGAGDAAVASLPAAGHRHHDLGRPARWRVDCAGALLARLRRARNRRVHRLRSRHLQHPGAGDEPAARGAARAASTAIVTAPRRLRCAPLPAAA